MTFARLVLDDVNRAAHVNDYASGKSINAARVVHTMGREVILTGFVGGSRGRMLCGDLDSTGIRHEFVMVGAETRQCITVIDAAAGTATELVEESSAVEENAWKALDQRLRFLLPQAAGWIFSGTLPPGAPQDFYARWLPLAERIGALAVVDARGEPLKLALEHPKAVFKLNRDEFAQTLNADLSQDDRLIDALRQQTPKDGRLIVTLGAGGAVGCDGKSCWRVHSPKVKAVSAVGSGDAFAAGLAMALSERQSLDDALRLAAACGAANAMTPLAGHLDPAEVNRLLPEVQIQRV